MLEATPIFPAAFRRCVGPGEEDLVEAFGLLDPWITA